MEHEELENLLRSRGIQPTTKRMAIGAALFARCKHLSADQLREDLDSRGERIAKATVYNTLNLFSRRALVREVVIEAGKVFYDSNTAAHHHLYNVDDGTLTDIDVAFAADFHPASLPTGATLEKIDVVIRVRNAERPVSGVELCDVRRNLTI